MPAKIGMAKVHKAFLGFSENVFRRDPLDWLDFIKARI